MARTKHDESDANRGSAEDGTSGTEPLDSEDALLRAVARVSGDQRARAVDRVGTIVGGRYSVIGILGQGGMGDVLLAEDTKMKRTVALKVLPEELADDPERRRRFLREARAASAVSHPNLAAIFDVGEDDGRIFLAMERVEGHTLREHLRSSRMSVAEVLRVGRSIALGVGRAHLSRIVHRDLKPENVMIGEDDAVKVLDFGLAKALDVDAFSPTDLGEADTKNLTTREGQIVGTPSYMSPEQARGGPTDARSDVFSLGIVLYEMATGAQPFKGHSKLDILAAIIRDQPALASSRNAEVTAGLDAVIARCLSKEPQRRYANAREIADALSALIDASPRGAPPTRGFAYVGLGAAALVGAAVAVFLSTTRSEVPAAASQSNTAPIASGSPLAAPGSTVACPPLRAKGVPGKTGWLGAAAANILCRRAVPILGGRLERRIVPADLLDFPHVIGDAIPLSPYDADDARERALVAARSRSAAYFDGEVTYAGPGFHVDLSLRESATDRELGTGTGDDPVLYRALRMAMTPLVASRALPLATEIDPEVALWTNVRDVELAQRLVDWEIGADVGPEELNALAPHKELLGASWPVIEITAAKCALEPRPRRQAPPLDRTSPAAFARTAVAVAMVDPRADVRALADELRELRAREESVIGKRTLAAAEALLLSRGDDVDRSRETLLQLLADEPQAPGPVGVLPSQFGPWDLAGNVYYGQSGAVAHRRAFALSYPDVADANNPFQLTDRRAANAIEYARRQSLLAPGFPLYVANLASALIFNDQPEEIRSLAAVAANHPIRNYRLVGEVLLVRLEARQARFSAALKRARRSLDMLPSYGLFERGDVDLVQNALMVAVVLGSASELADAFVRHFVDPDPPLLEPGNLARVGLSTVCALATKDVAKRCFDRVRDLAKAGFFMEGEPKFIPPLWQAAEQYALGDYSAAARTLRPLFAASKFSHPLAPMIFDRAGDRELTERADASTSANLLFNGASMADVRAARRASATGDHARAVELARQVVEAWSVADIDVPVLAEMKAIVANQRKAAAVK